MCSKKLQSTSLIRLRKQAEQLLNKSKITSNKTAVTDFYRLIHELNVNQIELEMQNNELQQTLLYLNESQHRYQELYDAAPVAYLCLNEKNFIIDANLAATRMLGIEKYLLINKSFSRFIAKNNQTIFNDHCYQVFAKKRKQTCELELIKKNGTHFYVHLESILIAPPETTQRQLQLSLIDITDRIHATRALKTSEEQFRSFVETTKEWVWAADIEGRVTYSNPSVELILGYTPKELLGKSIEMFVHQADHLLARKLFSTSVKKASGWNEATFQYRHKDGSVRYLESDAVPIIDCLSHLQGFRGTARDITLRKKIEGQINKQHVELDRAVKIGSLGELATELAHELTQPLTAINNFTTGCIRRLETGNYQTDELLHVMKQVATQAERAGKIIHSIKDFVKKGRLHFEVIDLHTLIRETLSFINKESSQPMLNICLKLSDAPLYLVADRIQISLVILNLVRNSMEAMAMDQTHSKKQQLTIQTQIMRDTLIKIRITDTGPGFNKEIAAKLFDPWFTTKPSGLGLGLAISRTIVEAHGGYLTAKTMPKHGAYFEFFLPIHQEDTHHDA